MCDRILAQISYLHVSQPHTYVYHVGMRGYKVDRESRRHSSDIATTILENWAKFLTILKTMPMQQHSLGGSASSIKVGEIGFGLMGTPLSVCEANYCQGFTMGGRSIPDEQCFEAMKAAIDAGATFWNAGVFYGRGPKGEPTNL